MTMTKDAKKRKGSPLEQVCGAQLRVWLTTAGDLRSTGSSHSSPETQSDNGPRPCVGHCRRVFFDSSGRRTAGCPHEGLLYQGTRP